MLRARQSLGSFRVALACVIAAGSAFGCRSMIDHVRLPRNAVVLSLKHGTEGYPVLFKKQHNRLVWFAADALQITVHLEKNPVPFEGMTAVNGGPCLGNDDCLIRCPTDQAVCISGKIAISDDQLQHSPDGFTYSYDFRLLPRKASADPGFIIKP